MADDIVKLAALRKQRRPRTGRSGEATLFHNENATGNDDLHDVNDPLQSNTLPTESPRSRGIRSRQQSQNEADFEEATTSRSRGNKSRQQSQNEADVDEATTPRQRGMRSRQQSQNEADFEDPTSSNENKIPLPFVACKISDTHVYALISTSNKQSLINRDIYHKIRNALSVDNRRQIQKVNVMFDDLQLPMTVDLQDDIPDVILGVDFLSENNCEISFKDRTLVIRRNGSLVVPFLKETDIPLKFRLHRNVAASF